MSQCLTVLYLAVSALFALATCTGTGTPPQFIAAPLSSSPVILVQPEARVHKADHCETIQSSVSLFASSSGGWLGSGVAIGDGSHVVTAYHCIDQTNGLVSVRKAICSGDGSRRLGKSLDAEVVAFHAFHDVALLHPKNGRVQPLRRTSEFASIGDTVRLFGSKTQGETGIVTETNQVHGPVEKGDSGGAVVNDRGELVGIAVKAFYYASDVADQSTCSASRSRFSNYIFVPISTAVSALIR